VADATQNGLFPDSLTAVGVLTSKEIDQEVRNGHLISRDTFSSGSLESSSYDVRVGRRGVLGGQGREIDLQTESLELEPGAYAGVVSLEKLILPTKIFARIGSKRALAYDGVILLTGSVVDPGYEGHLLFGLYNASQRKVLIRLGRKICNITFERLANAPEREAPVDANLRAGNFPDAFLDRMANMDVLPWMQISERVKQIETITKDILDLKARYEDVLQPIRDLTNNVKNLTQDVTQLTEQTRTIGNDLSRTNSLVTENGKQINQLTTNLATLVGEVRTAHEQTRRLDDSHRSQSEVVTALRTDFGRLKLTSSIVWAVVLLAVGGFLTELAKRYFISP